MKDEPDYELDARTTECAACGEECSEGHLRGHLVLCRQCFYGDVEVQAVLEADRRADEEDEVSHGRS